MEELSYDEILINPNKAEEILFQLYGIVGQASELPGEYDMNFKIQVNHKDSYILKISRPGEAIETLDFQQNLLQHLVNNNDGLIAPVPSLDLSAKLISEST